MPKYIVTLSDFTYLSRARVLVEAETPDQAAAIAHASPPEGDVWDGDWCDDSASFVSHIDEIKGDVLTVPEDERDANTLYYDYTVEKDDDVPFDELRYGYPSTLDVENHRKLLAFDELLDALEASTDALEGWAHFDSQGTEDSALIAQHRALIARFRPAPDAKAETQPEAGAQS